MQAPDEQLLLNKHPQQELFLCDVADAVLKDIMPHMEHPFYSLSKKPDTKIRRYEHKGNWLEITPSVKGMATIYDKDILIYAISQLMAKLNRKEEISKRIRINCRDLLMFTNRGTAGKDYSALCEAIDRLAGTRISTNITAGDEEQYNNFGLIDQGSIRRKDGLSGRLLWIELTVSDWVFDAIKSKAVLTLNRDYFRLSKPLERRVYEIARKHCGQKTEWSIKLDGLFKKSGSQGSLRRFRQVVRNIAEHNHLPDYLVEFGDAADMVTFRNRQTWWDSTANNTDMPIVQNVATYKKCQEIIGPHISIFAAEKEWSEYWISSGCPPLANPDAAFTGFCNKRYGVKDTLGAPAVDNN